MFLRNLQKFLVYFFTALSAIIVVLGMSRIKKDASLPITPSPNGSGSSNSLANRTTTSGSSGASTAGARTVAGSVVQTPFGDLAVSIETQNGKLTNVTMTKTPDSPPSYEAAPYLINQALKAGSANIAGVSGATYTSNAFRQSLESAIVKMGLSAATTAPKSTTVAKKTTTNTNVPSAVISGTRQKVAGSVVRTPYGNAEVDIEVQNGKIVNVTMPTVPDSPPSVYAAQQLIDQAIKAGSANIAGVSGATYTTNAFKQSLESAIAKSGITAPKTTVTSAPATIPASASMSGATTPTNTTGSTRSGRSHNDDDDD